MYWGWGDSWTFLRAPRISHDLLAWATGCDYSLPIHCFIFLEGWICKGRARAFVMLRLTLRNNVLTPCLLDIACTVCI